MKANPHLLTEEEVAQLVAEAIFRSTRRRISPQVIGNRLIVPLRATPQRFELTVKELTISE